MPSEMYERGRSDAEADALDESFYQYYYDYRLAYDAVMRARRRTRRHILLGKLARSLVVIVPLLALIGGGAFWYQQRAIGQSPLAVFTPSTPTVTPTRTPRPTLAAPTATPAPTNTAVPVLRADSFAVVTNTNDAPLLGHKAPGKKSPTVARFAAKERVQVLEGPQQADGLSWWRVKGKAGEGWSAGDFLAPVVGP